ncbi:MAG: sorbosone dehydrogenase family protein [Kofleriaceae bacterium]
MSPRPLVLLAVAACSTRSPNEHVHQDPVVTDAIVDSDTCGPPAPLAACAAPVFGTKVTARQIARVTGQAMLVTSPPEDPRLFVIEKTGRIRIIENEVLQPTPFLDLTSQLVVSSEQGLLGLAFHPNYNCNGQFFVYYTTSNANVVARCSVSESNPNLAEPTCTTVISIPDFASNHNGGMIEFGPDGYLYIGTGDGGQYGDPRRNAQALWDGSPFGNTVAWLGKMLRIDVDNPAPGSQYGIPADNPYANGGGKPEIFISGLRNPWRWSFDRATGDMWIGDVGQNQTEELNVLKAGEQAGKNLGWSIYEGNTCCKNQLDKCLQLTTQPCNPADKTFPLDTRSHSQGWISIIAGQVYRGSCYPDMVGWHFYTDYADNQLHKARLLTTGDLEVVAIPGTIPTGVSSIHADARGELYMTNTSGFVYHLEASQ